VSRLDAELAYGETEPVDIRDVVRGVIAIFQDRLGTDSRRLALAVQERPNAPGAFIVRGHEARLGRVVTNLLDNALSFSPEGGTVTVSVRRDGADIEIVVDDEGPGIPAGMHDDIFERFYSYRPQSDSTQGKNSGLGLSICRDIVDAYGGSIAAGNRADAGGAPCSGGAARAADKDRRQPGGAGARFTVRLPAASATSPRGAPQLVRRT
jgi:two-component system sensor histidine kinase ChvG